MVSAKDLNDAKRNKKDEFYTQLDTIEKEILYYKDELEGKVVYCNCDSPEYSKFWEYFHTHFSELKLKKLIATFYSLSEKPYKMEYYGSDDKNIKVGDKTYLKFNGDFRSFECKEILKTCDVVITNPPFSLFRQFIAQLIEYNKDFLVLGNMNAVTTKDIFNLFLKQKMFYGASIKSGDIAFTVPESYELNAAGCGLDENGKKFIRVKGIRWFTNMDYEKRHEFLELDKTYNPEDYPKYDNYDAINVNKTCDIPKNYYDLMGVPITFLDKFCPEQFELIGNENTLNIPKGRGYIKGKRLYSRIFIRIK